MIRTDAPPAGSLLARLPWLRDACRWRHRHRADESARTGTWAIGNGWVFAHAGLASPASRLQGIVGPTYQTAAIRAPEGAFGDTWVSLERAGAPNVALEELWRPRGTGILVSVKERGPSALVTVSFAPPDRPVLVRLVEVWGGGRLDDDALLVVAMPAGTPSSPGVLQATCPRGRVLCAGLSPSGRAAEGMLTVPLTDLDTEGGVTRATVVLACGDGAGEAQEALGAVRDPVALLEETRAHWSAWLGRARIPDLWAQRTDGLTGSVEGMHDLIESVLVCLRTQRALPGGAVGPMLHYKGAWARDNNGPVRALLALGYLDEVRDILEYYYRASAALQRIPNSVPLDLDLPGGDPPFAWSDIPVPHAEVPAWIVLQHGWWLEVGGDADLVAEHWDYLMRCATGPQPSPEGLLPFHGDETYLHGALYAAYPDRVGWPNDLIAEDGEHGYAPWSLDSSLAYIAALKTMARMAPRVGRARGYDRIRKRVDHARTALERHYWMEDLGRYAPAVSSLTGEPHALPFAPIDLRRLWLGGSPRNHPRARGNLDAVVGYCGITHTTPSCAYTVGHQGGYLLENLLAVRSDLAPRALAHLVRLAVPAGEWAELYDPDGRPTYSYDPAAPNRYRPWESGVNLAAILRYFHERRADDEPALDDTPLTPRRAGTSAPRCRRRPAGPASVIALVAATDEVDAVRSEAAELGCDTPTILDAGLPLSADDLESLLFDPASDTRRADALIVAPNAATAGRRTQKPEGVWGPPPRQGVLRRFEEAGGRLLGAPGHH